MKHKKIKLHQEKEQTKKKPLNITVSDVALIAAILAGLFSIFCNFVLPALGY